MFLTLLMSFAYPCLADDVTTVAFVADGATYDGSASLKTTIKNNTSGNIVDETFTAGDITFKLTKQKSDNNNDQVNTNVVRWYATHIITFTANTGYVIKNIKIQASSAAYAKALGTTSDPNGMSYTTNTEYVTWTGSASEVKITAAAQCRFKYIEVTYEKKDTGIELSCDPTSGVAYLSDKDSFVQPIWSVTPASAMVTYSSDKEGIATVDTNGKITLVGVGTAVITATAATQTIDGVKYTGKTAEYTLTVEETKPLVTASTYTLVKDKSKINSTDELLVVTAYDGNYYAMKNNVENKHIIGKEINVSDDKISLSSENVADYGIFNLVQDNSQPAKYALHGDSGYVIKGTNNTDTQFSDTPFYGSCEVNSSGTVTLDIATSSRHLRGFKSTSTSYSGPDFRGYTDNSGYDIYFYKKEGPVEQVTPSNPVFSPKEEGETTGVYPGDQITITSENATHIAYKVNNSADYEDVAGNTVNYTIPSDAEVGAEYVITAYGINRAEGKADLTSEVVTVTYQVLKQQLPKPKQVTFSPEGGLVMSGTEVTMTCEADRIVYKVGEGEPQTVNGKTTTYVINEDVTITAWGENGEGEDLVKGDETTVSYQLKQIDGNKYQLISNVSDLKIGDKLLIVSAKENGAAKAMSTTQNDNNRGIADVDVVKNDDQGITFIDGIYNDVQVLTLGNSSYSNEEGNADYKYTFYTGEKGYLYAASDSKNYLRTEVTDTKEAGAKINFKEDGSVEIIFNNAHGYLQYNPSSKIFSCYTPQTTSQQPVYIYKLIEKPEITLVGETDYELYVDGDVELNYTLKNAPENLVSYEIRKDGERLITGSKEENEDENKNVYVNFNSLEKYIDILFYKAGSYEVEVIAQNLIGTSSATATFTVKDKENPNLHFTQKSYSFPEQSEDDLYVIPLAGNVVTNSDSEIKVEWDNENVDVEIVDGQILICAFERVTFNLTLKQAATTMYKGAEVTVPVSVGETYPELSFGSDEKVFYLEDAVNAGKVCVDHELQYPTDIEKSKITYTSTDTDVAFFHVEDGPDHSDDEAWVNHDGHLHLSHAGVTIITASFAGDDKYAPQEVCFYMTVEHFKSDEGTLKAPIPFDDEYNLITMKEENSNSYEIETNYLLFEHSDRDVTVVYKRAAVQNQSPRMNVNPRADENGWEELESTEVNGVNQFRYDLDDDMKTNGGSIMIAAKKGDEISDPHIFAIAVPTGIGSVESDGDGEAIYFNLQGVRIYKPVKGGIYIKVEGSKSSKVAL